MQLEARGGVSIEHNMETINFQLCCACGIFTHEYQITGLNKAGCQRSRYKLIQALNAKQLFVAKLNNTTLTVKLLFYLEKENVFK